MNELRFDRWARALTDAASRRQTIAASFLGGFALLGGGDGIAAKKKRKRKKKKVKFNDFGCVNVGNFCKTRDQCCSGLCEGKKGKKKCQAHDASTCTGGDGCNGEFVACAPTEGVDGSCVVTTGNASYCTTVAVCFDCTKDADCVPVCGAGAACIVCAECVVEELQTACASLNETGCIPV